MPQKTLKLARPGITDTAPEKKASEFVKDVIVIDGPAYLRASLILYSVGKCNGTWSKALQTTNMSSIPTPISKT